LLCNYTYRKNHDGSCQDWASTEVIPSGRHLTTFHFVLGSGPPVNKQCYEFVPLIAPRCVDWCSFWQTWDNVQTHQRCLYWRLRTVAVVTSLGHGLWIF